MALDSRVTAEIGIQVADSLNALDKINQYGTKIGEVFKNIIDMSNKLELGNKKQANALRAEVQTFQRLIGEASTLRNVIDSVQKRAQNGLFNTTLDVQRIGQLSLEASKLVNGLEGANKASAALAQRLAMVKKEAAAVTEAGGVVRNSVTQRAENFQARLRDIKALENSIRRIDQDALAKGGFSKQSQQVRNQLAAAEMALMEKISNKRTSNFDKEIGLVRRLRDELKQNMREEQTAATQRLRNIEREEKAANELAERKRLLRRKLREDEDREARAELARINRAEQLLNRDLTAVRRANDRREARRETAITRAGDSLAPFEMRQLSQQIGARATLERMTTQQAAAAARLAELTRAGTTATDQQIGRAQIALETANKRVRAAERLVAAEERTTRLSAQARSGVLDRINMNESQLRASLDRGARNFSFTPDQARGFDMTRVRAQIDQNIQRLGVMQQLMSRALNVPRGDAEQAANRLARLQRAWEMIAQKTSEAMAKERQYNQLPEQRGARVREMVRESMFGDGGIALGTRMAGAIGIGMGISAVFSGLSSSLRTIAQMEDELAKLQAISGSTDGEMQNLARSIFEVGNSSRYSTLEIAQGATTIAQAGFSAAETGEVLKNAMNLAAASGSTPAESIDLMTSALGAFNLQASESAVVADTIAAALNETKLSVEQFRLAVQYAGATAKENNISIQELAAVTGSLANAGIRSGSTIGTGMRQLLVDLKTPTADFKKELDALGLTLADVDVKTLGYAQVVRNLTEAGFSAEQAYASFEVRAASSFLAFRNQLDSYDDLAIALQQSGAAARAAAEANDSLSAKWTMLKNNLLDLVSTLGSPLLNILKTVVDGVGAITSSLNTFIQSVTNSDAASNQWATTLGSALTPALIGLAVSGGNPLGALIGGLLGVVGALAQADFSTNKYTETANRASAALTAQRQTTSSLEDAKRALIERESQLQDGSRALQAETLTLTERFAGLAEKIDFTKLSYNDLLKAMQEVSEESLTLQKNLAQEVVLQRGREQREFFNQTESARDRVVGVAGWGRLFGNGAFSDTLSVVNFFKRIEGMSREQLEGDDNLRNDLNKVLQDIERRQ